MLPYPLIRTLTVSSDGQLRSYGIEPATDIAAPKDGLVLARNVAQVEAEDLFAAYIDKKGALYTWGQNGSFQLVPAQWSPLLNLSEFWTAA